MLLRRWHWCKGDYHDVIVEAQGDEPDADDPRWPTHCAKGTPFADADERQIWDDPL